MSNDDGRADDKPAGEPHDVALIHGVTPDGDLRVLRQRSDRLELGAIRPLREGAPIVGEVVRLTPRKEFPLLCDVKTELQAPAALATAESPAGDSIARVTAPPSRKGPAQVASDDYRKNWDVIWSKPKPGAGFVN